jgi:hypothetical protein
MIQLCLLVLVLCITGGQTAHACSLGRLSVELAFGRRASRQRCSMSADRLAQVEIPCEIPVAILSSSLRKGAVLIWERKDR